MNVSDKTYNVSKLNSEIYYYMCHEMGNEWYET